MDNCVMLPTITDLPLSMYEQMQFNHIDSLFFKTNGLQNVKEMNYYPNNNKDSQFEHLINNQKQSSQFQNTYCQNDDKKYSQQTSIANNNLQFNQMFYNNYCQNNLNQINKIQNEIKDLQLQIKYLQKKQAEYMSSTINYPYDYNTVNTSLSNSSINPLYDNIENDKKKFHTKGFWSHEEDEKLIAAVNETKPCVWEIVASKVPGRSPVQCKERWLYRLHPDVNKAKFEKWEDEIIINERKKMGNSWTYISTKLNGRTSLAVKNRWYSVLRKEINQS